MRATMLLLLLAAVAAAGDLGRALRALKSEDRETRREVLKALAEGRLRAQGDSEKQRTERELKRFLGSRSLGAERALAVRALGRLELEAAYEKILGALGRETDDRVLEAAEQALRLAPPAVAALAVERFDGAKDPLERAAFLRVLAVLPGEDARRRIAIRAGSAEDWCPRAAALLALSRERDAGVFPLLMAALDDDDPGVRSAAVESLTRLTGKPFGSDVIQWKAWWNTGGKTAPMKKATLKPAEKKKPDARRYAHEVDPRDEWGPYYFGIPVRGRKVVFVFDISASMRYKLPLAFEQLVGAVKGLPSRSLFEVVFFNEFVWPWRGRLSRADPVTKELLVRHLPTLEVKSYTNLFDAIEKALALGPDEVFVISDGEPNRGRKRLPKQIVSELRRINTAKTTIHTISITLVRDGDEHVALLKEIAEDHGGKHVERTLR